MARFGELFAGIGGLSRAMEMHGHEPAWFAELDKDASLELARKYPGIPNHGDVTKIDYSKVERVEILGGGGWPCQPFSSAGLGGGMDDERYLWPEVARAIRALRPRVFVMEQVPDILNERKFPGVFSRCLSDLAEAGMSARWGCLRSSDVGAPHRRERLFLVAIAEGEQVGTSRLTREHPLAPVGDSDGKSEATIGGASERSSPEPRGATTAEHPDRSGRSAWGLHQRPGRQDATKTELAGSAQDVADPERVGDDGGGASWTRRSKPQDGCCRHRRRAMAREGRATASTRAT